MAKYDHAVKAAAAFMEPKPDEAVEFGRLVFLILEAIYAAEREVRGDTKQYPG